MTRYTMASGEHHNVMIIAFNCAISTSSYSDDSTRRHIYGGPCVRSIFSPIPYCILHVSRLTLSIVTSNFSGNQLQSLVCFPTIRCMQPVFLLGSFAKYLIRLAAVEDPCVLSMRSLKLPICQLADHPAQGRTRTTSRSAVD